jgi:rubredoxin
MHRKLVSTENQSFWGWGCSECAWVFNPSGPPAGHSIQEMKQKYAQQRDHDFATHLCAEHPKAKPPKS